jgi:hypothetical protein
VLFYGAVQETLLRAFSMNITRQSLGVWIVVLLTFATARAFAAKNEAHVTRIIREVKLLPSQAAPKPAALNDTVNDNTAVRTGDSSRSELTFVDLRITRLGANTLFAFNTGGHNVQLNAGSMLLYVPKNVGGAQMATSAVSVAITGTTVIFESRKAGRTILKVFEGGARAALIKYPRESVFVRAGQMVDVPAGATKMPQPVNMNTADELKSPLFADFPPLPSQNLIATAPNPPGNSTVVSLPTLPIVPWLPGRVIHGSRPPPTRGGSAGTTTGNGTVDTDGTAGRDGTTTTGTAKPPTTGGRGKLPVSGKTTKPVVGVPVSTNGTPAPSGGTIFRGVSQQPGHVTGKPAGNAASVKSSNPTRTPTPRPFPSKRTKKPQGKIG